MVEQLPFKQLVLGSNPSRPTKFPPTVRAFPPRLIRPRYLAAAGVAPASCAKLA